MKKIAVDQIQGFQEIFDFFNDNLFSGELPDVILNFSRSGAKTLAFFKPNTWSPEGGKHQDSLPEISLTPRFLHRSKMEIFSTLVHEQCHLWQHTFGKKKSRTGYHNREWADKMLDIGLKPISGNGGMTGQSVHHEVIPGGKFEASFKVIEKDLRLPFLVLGENITKKSKQTRSKYMCDKCCAIVYGKRDIKIICGDCNV
ncbi:MAG: hypothetical protein E6R04_11995 [Spirochaetes bacterium]|nr:MAG: hypothetical protein E6R04_11995 [Spirochaetota bacterium]